jgi:ABC-type proline/glycine betaine transport system permease subunit
MIAFLVRALIIYCLFIIIRNVFVGMKEKPSKKKKADDNAIEAKFRRLD